MNLQAAFSNTIELNRLALHTCIVITCRMAVQILLDLKDCFFRFPAVDA